MLCSVAHILNLAEGLVDVKLTCFSDSCHSCKLVHSGGLGSGDGKKALSVLPCPSCCIDIRRQKCLMVLLSVRLGSMAQYECIGPST